MQLMAQNIIGYPWASPQGKIGRLDLTTGSGHGTVRKDVPPSLADSANYQSLCRCFAGHHFYEPALAAQAAEEQCYYLVTCLVSL